MEIDFLGLSSSRYGIQQQGPMNIFSDSANGGVETSLSLNTSSCLDTHSEPHKFTEKNKTWEFPACDKMSIPSCSGSTVCSLAPYNQGNSCMTEQPGLQLVATPVFHHPSATGFLYDLNNAASPNLRNMSALPVETTSLTMLYPGCASVFEDPQKVVNNMYIAGNASTGLSHGGYTPTIAMARRATLARFLEKRLHRMNQGRTSHLMGKPLNASNIPEACDTNIAKGNKKRSNHLKRRQ